MSSKLNSVFVSGVVLLAGCGGESNVSIDPPQYDSVVVDRFSDGSGIIKSTHDGPVSAVARDIASTNGLSSITRIIGTPDADAAIVVDPAGFDVPLDGVENFMTTDLGKYYHTAADETGTVNGEQASVAIFQDSTSGTTIIASTVDGKKTIQVTGETVSEIPNETFTYRGTNLVVNMTSDWLSERGEFEMMVNFSNKTATINSSTASSSLSGNLAIDTMTGALTGSNLALVSPDGNNTATFIGTFNGEGATGVSALS